MDTEAINTETSNIHYTAHQFWEQEGPKAMLLEVIKKLSVNAPAHNIIHMNVDESPFNHFQQKSLKKVGNDKAELSFVDDG